VRAGAVARYRLAVVGYHLAVARYRLAVVGYRLAAAMYGLVVARNWGGTLASTDRKA